MFIKLYLCILISVSGTFSRTYEFRGPDVYGRQFVFGNPNWFTDVGNLMNNFNNNGYSTWPGLNTHLQNFPTFLANINQPEGMNQNQGIFSPFNFNQNNPFQSLFGNNPLFLQPQTQQQNGIMDQSVQTVPVQSQNPLLTSNNNPFNLAQQLFSINPTPQVPVGQNSNPVVSGQNNPLGLLQQQFQQLMNNNPFIAPFQPQQQKKENEKNPILSPTTNFNPNKNIGTNNKDKPVQSLPNESSIPHGAEVPNQVPGMAEVPINELKVPIVPNTIQESPPTFPAQIPSKESVTPTSTQHPIQLNKEPTEQKAETEVGKISPVQQTQLANIEPINSGIVNQPQPNTPAPAVQFTTHGTVKPTHAPALQPEKVDIASTGKKQDSTDDKNSDKVDYSNYDYDALFNDNKEPKNAGNKKQPPTGTSNSNPSDLLTFSNNEASHNELDSRINLVEKPKKSQQ